MHQFYRHRVIDDPRVEIVKGWGVSNGRSVEGVVKAKIAAKSRDLSITTALDDMALPKAPTFGA